MHSLYLSLQNSLAIATLQLHENTISNTFKKGLEQIEVLTPLLSVLLETAQSQGYLLDRKEWELTEDDLLELLNCNQLDFFK